MGVEFPFTFVSESPERTRAFGAALGRVLLPGTVVALDGDLGAGKTCLVQGLAAGLDVTDAVTSPTYALLQSYRGRLDLHHFDAYMEGRERALLHDGGLEWMHAGGIAVIEWAVRVQDVLPRPLVCVRLEHVGPSERRIRIAVEGDGPDARRLENLVAGVLPASVGRGARDTR
jgi:tRNA threonylcarbamoyladenosine biosynthesis protein TsaE